MPSHQRLMRMLSLAVVPEERSGFRQRFRAAKQGGCHGDNNDVVGVTPLRWIAQAFQSEPEQLTTISDMFPESGTESEFLNEFYVMDVILNRALKPHDDVDDPGTSGIPSHHQG